MAYTTIISQYELERQANLAYLGKSYKLFLAVNPGGLTADSLAADWVAGEISGNGYAAVIGIVGAGQYRAAAARFEMPAIVATFQASGGSIVYDTVCMHFVGEDYLHSVTVETPSITLADGEAKSYSLTLVQDD
jgi:hypothetical protein